MDRRQLPLIFVAPTFTALIFSAILVAVFAPAVAHAEIFQWKDAAGRVHFGDRAPGGTPGGNNAATTRIAAASAATTERITINIEDAQGVLDDDSRAQVESGVGRIFAIYTGLFRLGMRKPVVVDIHLFETHAELGAWVAGVDRSIGNLPPGILGLYMPKQNLIGAWRHSNEPQAIVTTLLHEASHVLLSQLSPGAPAWLQEGLAQYFEGLDTAEDGYVIRPPADAEKAINAWVARKQLVTLDQYFSLDEQQWRHLAHVEQNPVPYVVAWSVSYFLMSKPVGRQIVGELLQDMEKTRRPPTANAIEKRYPGGYALMEYEWFKWAQGAKAPQTLSW